MDSDISERVNALIGSIETEMDIAITLFILLALILAISVKRNNKLSLKETMLFMTGLKNVKTNWKERILHIAAVILPLLIIVIAIQSKNAT